MAQIKEKKGEKFSVDHFFCVCVCVCAKFPASLEKVCVLITALGFLYSHKKLRNINPPYITVVKWQSSL